MSKVITFSTRFAAQHPRAGEFTYFVEQVLNSLRLDYRNELYVDLLFEYNETALREGKLTERKLRDFARQLNPAIETCKHHTCRSGQRFAAGESFSPRVWSGRPYLQPQIIFCSDRPLPNVWAFDIDKTGYHVNGSDPLTLQQLRILAQNDGLTSDDFECWFDVDELHGQVICWDAGVDYGK